MYGGVGRGGVLYGGMGRGGLVWGEGWGVLYGGVWGVYCMGGMGCVLYGLRGGGGGGVLYGVNIARYTGIVQSGSITWDVGYMGCRVYGVCVSHGLYGGGYIVRDGCVRYVIFILCDVIDFYLNNLIWLDNNFTILY